MPNTTRSQFIPELLTRRCSRMPCSFFDVVVPTVQLAAYRTRGSNGRDCRAGRRFPSGPATRATVGSARRPRPQRPPPRPPPPALPAVPLSITDGQSAQTLLSNAITLASVGVDTTALQAGVDAIQAKLDKDAVVAEKMSLAATQADQRAAAASAQAQGPSRASIASTAPSRTPSSCCTPTARAASLSILRPGTSWPTPLTMPIRPSPRRGYSPPGPATPKPPREPWPQRPRPSAPRTGPPPGPPRRWPPSPASNAASAPSCPRSAAASAERGGIRPRLPGGSGRRRAPLRVVAAVHAQGRHPRPGVDDPGGAGVGVL